jgi:hypothetical protein
MQSSLRPPRNTSRFSDSFLHELNKYALAASAAGVEVLALAQPAQAKVVYTSTHKWLRLNTYVSIDLNHDGVNDFYFSLYSHSSVLNGTFLRMLQVKGVSRPRNQVYSVLSSGYTVAAALPNGAKIGPERGFQNHLSMAIMFAVGNGYNSSISQGPWRKVTKQAYLGLRFVIKGKIHYGWARLGHISHNKPARALLTGYAYETIPNKPIIAGETKGPDVITLSDTLGGLAKGAVFHPKQVSLAKQH